MIAPLDPRDAFFGGRTGATTLHAEAGADEEIRYLDTTSLYPWVKKYKTYPVRFPQLIINPRDQDISHYFGIAQVDVLPPEHLFHPILPVCSNGKLTFPLSAACVQEQQKEPWLQRTNICPYTDEERKLRGVWCTEELKKAKELG